MKIEFEHGSGRIKANLAVQYDISLSIRKQGNVNCYHLDEPSFAYFESEAFSGNISAGGSVNCEKMSLYAHASGTHTECALHVCEAGFDMRHVLISPLQLCRLITVQPSEINGDRCIDMESIGLMDNHESCTAIVFRTLPNNDNKIHQNYSGCNPPYFAPEVLARMKVLGYRHLLTDLPSIDRESDGGKLQAHKIWFLNNDVPDASRTITELIYAPQTVPDGLYALSMQCPSIETDAVPSRIVLYPCV